MEDDESNSKPAETLLEFDENQPEPVVPEPKKRIDDEAANLAKSREPRGSKWLSLGIFLLVLVLIGAGLYFFVLSDSDDNATTNETDQAQSDAESANESVVQNYSLSSVVYGFGVSFESSADIYTRPADGGDRESLVELDTINSIGLQTFGQQGALVQSEKFAYVVDNTQIFVGDGDGEPEMAFEEATDGDPENGLGITSAVISPDGSKVAFTYVASGIGEPVVRILDVNSGEASTIVESAKIGPLQWSHDNSKLMFGPNILGAGAQLETPYVLDIETNEKTPIAEGENPYTFPVYAFSHDGNAVAYISPTIDLGRTTDDIVGYYVGSPYTVAWKNLRSGDVQEIEEVKGQVMPSSLQWQQGTKNILYAQKNKLYSYNTESSETANIYDTTGGDIDMMYAADDTRAIFGQRQEDQTYIVYTLDIKKQDRSEIMQTTDATVPLGILLQ